jgi:hypothetical protein
MLSSSVCRRLLVCLGALCVASSGCLMPTLRYENYQTFATPVAPVKGQVHAFRVDIETHSDWERHRGVDCSSWPRRQIHQLTSISVDTARGLVPSQECRAWSYGWTWCVPFYYWRDADVRHGVGVRLYAPGYQLIVLKEGQDVRELTWKAAADLRGQVAALDALFFPGDLPRTSELEKDLTVALAPGSVNGHHLDALLFGVSEYDRLLATVRVQSPADAELLKRLEERARQLSDLAKK